MEPAGQVSVGSLGGAKLGVLLASLCSLSVSTSLHRAGLHGAMTAHFSGYRIAAANRQMGATSRVELASSSGVPGIALVLAEMEGGGRSTEKGPSF